MINIFTVFTHKKNIYIVNLYQIELLGCFCEGMKMRYTHNVLNWYTGKWLLLNIYVDSMGLSTVNSRIF